MAAPAILLGKFYIRDVMAGDVTAPLMAWFVRYKETPQATAHDEEAQGTSFIGCLSQSYAAVWYQSWDLHPWQSSSKTWGGRSLQERDNKALFLISCLWEE